MKHTILMLGLITALLPGFSQAAENSVQEVGDQVYLQACGADPQAYLTEPKLLGNFLQEAPNTIIDLNPSPYGRPFSTVAKSTIAYKADAKLTAELSNFRDLKVTDASGKVLYKREVSGATSIYELRHNNQTFAWAVGWNKRCYEYYEDTAFTVLRVIFPVQVNGKLKIKDKVFKGAYIKAFTDALSKSKKPVLMQSDDIYSFGATTCYYCLPRIFQMDKNSGFKEVKTVKELNNLNIDLAAAEPLIYASWLAQYGLIKDLVEYISNHYDEIHKSALNYIDWTKDPGWHESDFEQQKRFCMQELFDIELGEATSLSAIGWACFPELQYYNYFDDLTKSRK